MTTESRTATVDDFEHICVLLRSLQEHSQVRLGPHELDPIWFRARFNILVESRQGFVHVLDDDAFTTNPIQGVLIAGVGESPFFNVPVADEYAWWINPEYRGHGLRMLRAYEKWAFDQGAKIIGLSSFVERTSMFFERKQYLPGEMKYYKVIK